MLANGEAKDYKVIDASINPSIDGAHYIDLAKVMVNSLNLQRMKNFF
jgi:hypothetical protein